MRKLLEPSSPLHREKDIAQLRTHVARVCALVDELDKSSTKLHFDRALAYRGIVQEAAPPKTKATKKPALNTSDMNAPDVYDSDDGDDDVETSASSAVDDEQRMSE